MQCKNIKEGVLSSLLSFIVDMSILFIGEKNIGNYRSPYFSNNQHEVSIVRREKRLKQQQYRLELFQQMRQKSEKARRMKQDQAIYNRRYERMHTEQPHSDKNEHLAQGPVSYQKINRQLGVFDRNPMLKMRKKQNELIQDYPSSYSFSSKSPEFQDNGFLHKINANKYGERMKTENLYVKGNEKNRFDTFAVDLQKRRQELNDYQDKKIDEVYEKMLGSVQILHGNADNNYPSKISKFENRRYNKYSPSKYQINPQEQEASNFKLPPLYKQPQKQEESSQQSSDRSWREWYAKEKLKELEIYYKNVVNNEPITHSRLSSSYQPGPQIQRHQY